MIDHQDLHLFKPIYLLCTLFSQIKISHEENIKKRETTIYLSIE